MPTYYFDVHGLPPAPDEVGEELRDHDAAWSEATQFAAALFKDVDGKLRPGQDWRLTVTDADRNQIYVIEIKTHKAS
jgi:hypothetical protein